MNYSQDLQEYSNMFLLLSLCLFKKAKRNLWADTVDCFLLNGSICILVWNSIRKLDTVNKSLRRCSTPRNVSCFVDDKTGPEGWSIVINVIQVVKTAFRVKFESPDTLFIYILSSPQILELQKNFETVQDN